MTTTFLDSRSLHANWIPLAFESGAARQDLSAEDVANSRPEPAPVHPTHFTGLKPARPALSPVTRTRLITERAGITLEELNEIRIERCDAHSHWGLNE